MYPEKLKVIAQQVQLQQQQEQVRLLHQEKLEREQQHLRTQVSGRGLQGLPEAGLGLPDPASVPPAVQQGGPRASVAVVKMFLAPRCLAYMITLNP